MTCLEKFRSNLWLEVLECPGNSNMSIKSLWSLTSIVYNFIAFSPVFLAPRHLPLQSLGVWVYGMFAVRSPLTWVCSLFYILCKLLLIWVPVLVISRLWKSSQVKAIQNAPSFLDPCLPSTITSCYVIYLWCFKRLLKYISLSIFCF